MHVLLTNDDGIGAQGLNALRRELARLDQITLSVVAPSANQSATARSITTREPLSVREIDYDDGGRGFAVGGTPVDCVRCAELGLVGERPQLIVSGINHGANLGDDITYSGTVAAALEGVVLGIPSIALSQQSTPGELGYSHQRPLNFEHSAPIAARLVAELADHPPGDGTLLNVNFPAGRPQGVEVARLGKRIYNDELKLLETDDDGIRSYQVYGWNPTHDEEEGTDLTAVAAGRVAVTPLHFDLTHHEGLEEVRGRGLGRLLEALPDPDGVGA